MISLEWGEFEEGINYSKLTYKLLNTLIFADVSPFAVADLESDSSLVLSECSATLAFCQGGMVEGFFCLLYQPGL